MKRYLILLSIICLSGTLLLGCKSQNDNTNAGNEPTKSLLAEKSYRYYDGMDQLTVDGRKVMIVLPENQAIPYRWQLLCSDAGVPVEDETIDDDSFHLSAGVSDAYRVFSLDLTTVQEVTLDFYLSRIHSEDAKEDYVQEIHYRIVETDGILTGTEIGN